MTSSTTTPRTGWSVPTQCAVCHGWGPRRVCGDCERRFVRRTHRCAGCALHMPDGVTVCGACIRQPSAFDHVLAAVDYSHPWDGLIGRFKFHDALDLADTLSRTLADAWRHSGLARPDLMLPVPLSTQRLRERGFNQSWELTRRIARAIACRTDARLLLRMRDTAHQIDLPRSERANNVRGAFAVEPLRATELRGLSVAVVDDVMTTGATAQEMAVVLKQAGALRVELWVLARTPAPGG